MTFDFLAMKTTSTVERKAEKERQKEEERATAQAIEQVMPSLIYYIFFYPFCLFVFPPDVASGGLIALTGVCLCNWFNL